MYNPIKQAGERAQSRQTRRAKWALGARLLYGRSGGVMGSWIPATAGIFNYTPSRFPWSARNIPDGPIYARNNMYAELPHQTAPDELQQ